ncbi:aspartyl-phosphate phosphatase Spo0E family protein [Bacillus sp. OK048]|uniref:aspartyl-phosphate phosphatase Spo0E family protein n=1 Tax=Bacillus sp. OK048 TaxID=1882761 RepID=UPI00088FEDC9|nr:aspartyl-phosphate phosphatase Spo0E family protein [Bacillus sp. OK048]SDM15470.1 Spo0E like sporulation regulatory protein [Bacillus sp. OK048]
MHLRAAIECYKRIGVYRKELYSMAIDREISHPDVINISQQLDKEIINIQKIIQEVGLFGVLK